VADKPSEQGVSLSLSFFSGIAAGRRQGWAHDELSYYRCRCKSWQLCFTRVSLMITTVQDHYTLYYTLFYFSSNLPNGLRQYMHSCLNY
jgi:hypothetical protein